VPAIFNIREHYNPARATIIRKELRVRGKLWNARVQFVRLRKHKFSKHYFKDMGDILDKINDKIVGNSLEEFDLLKQEEEGSLERNRSSMGELAYEDMLVQLSAPTSQNKLSPTGRREKRRGNTIARTLENAE
jgi:hypothetical protein